jgi:hypothetical protein
VRKPSGTWRSTERGYNAFHPNPLPPIIDWTPGLMRALSDADSRLGKLAGEGRNLPNPDPLIRPFVRRDRVYCARDLLNILEERAHLGMDPGS